MTTDQSSLSYTDFEPDPLERYAAIYDPDYEDTTVVRRPRNGKKMLLRSERLSIR